MALSYQLYVNNTQQDIGDLQAEIPAVVNQFDETHQMPTSSSGIYVHNIYIYIYIYIYINIHIIYELVREFISLFLFNLQSTYCIPDMSYNQASLNDQDSISFIHNLLLCNRFLRIARQGQ